MSVSIDQSGKALVASGLISVADVKALWAAIPAGERPKDGEAFAKLLASQSKLNDFQAKELLGGSRTPLILGDYLLLAKIGAGGMGQVFKAQHRHMDRLAAIKLLPEALTKDEEAVKRFQREVKAAARLTHPNIVQAFDASMQRGVWYLVMEYVEGQDLSAVVKKNGPLPVQEAVDCILQAAKGLAFAHSQGVIHRDIKPANLLLDKHGVVKILDMGLARIGDPTADNDGLTQSGQVMGTIDYMAPEQALNTRTADARADIYSLGCTLYRLLTGESPFGGETMMEKLLAHREQPIPSLNSRRNDVPRPVEVIYQKMMAKEATARYQTMAEVVTDLEQWKGTATQVVSGSAAKKQGEPDSKLQAFFNNLTDQTLTKAPNRGTATATRPVAPVSGLEPTMSLRNADVGTDSKSDHHLPTGTREVLGQTFTGSPNAGHGRKKPPMKLIAGGLFGALLILAGVIIYIYNDKGEKVGQLELPPGHTAKIETKTEPGKATTPSANTISTPPRELPTTGAPPLAKAPFDSATAKKHQEAWAKHLDMKVETIDKTIGAKMILIPPGEFLMGSTDEQVEAALKVAEELKADQYYKDRIMKNERPQHRVVITKPFLMGATEVTVGQFRQFVEATKYQTEAEKYGFGDSVEKVVSEKITDIQKQRNWLTPGYAVNDESPVSQVTWNDACAFCNWLSEKDQQTSCYRTDGSGGWFVSAKGTGYRLPTEAEWEYACRAGTTTQYSFGDDYQELQEYGWFNKNAGGHAWAVGLKSPNPFGLFDIHGNLQEWCQDAYEEKWYDQSSPNRADDPTGPSAGSNRVIRGGYWFNLASYCRSAYRSPYAPSARSNNLGFRIVRVW